MRWINVNMIETYKGIKKYEEFSDIKGLEEAEYVQQGN